MDITRLYDFIVGQPIKSSEVDDELNQLVATINALDSANIGTPLNEGALKPQSGIARGSTNATPGAPGASYFDVPGASATFTPVAACVVIVHAAFSFDIPAGDGANVTTVEGVLTVDGTPQSNPAKANGGRYSVESLTFNMAQNWRVALTGGAPHTVKLQYRVPTGKPANPATMKGAESSMSWFLLAQ